MSNDGFDEAADLFQRGLEARMIQVACMRQVLESLRIQEDGTQPVPGLLIEVYAWVTAPCVILTTPLMREDDHVSVSVELDDSPEPRGEAGATMVIKDDGPAGGVAGLFEAHISMARPRWHPLAVDIIRRTITDLEGSALKAGEAKTVVTELADDPQQIINEELPAFFGDVVEEVEEDEQEPDVFDFATSVVQARAFDDEGGRQIQALRNQPRGGPASWAEDDHGEEGFDAPAVFATAARDVIEALGNEMPRGILVSPKGEFAERGRVDRLYHDFPDMVMDRCRSGMTEDAWRAAVVIFVEMVAARLRWFKQCCLTADRGGCYNNLFGKLTRWVAVDSPGYCYGLAKDHEAPPEGWGRMFTDRVRQLLTICDDLDPDEAAPAPKVVVDGVLDMRSASPSRRSDPPDEEDDSLDEDWCGREETSGRVGVVISGVFKTKALERLRRVLDLESLIWVNAEDTRRVETVCDRIANGSFEVIVQTIRWVSHEVDKKVTLAVKKAQGAGLSPLLVRPRSYGHVEVRRLLEDVEEPEESIVEEDTATVDAVA